MIPKSKIEFLKEKFRRECEKCGGAGCGSCNSKISRILKYAEANIPIDYWMLAFKNFKGDKKFKELMREHIKDMDTFYGEGRSFAFVGNLGTGKTYVASAILKRAIISGYSAKYAQMAEVVNSLLSSNVDSATYLERLLEVDFLVIDEFDARWVFPSEKSERMFGSTLEYILRTRFQNHMPTILCSNTEDIDQVLADDFSRSFSSLRNQYMEVIYVAGKDFRKC